MTTDSDVCVARLEGSCQDHGVSDELNGGMDTIRMATLNFRGFVRGNAGGVTMGCQQVARLFCKYNLDILVVTEHKMGGDNYNVNATHRLLHKEGLDCVISGGISPSCSHGTGVMIVWKRTEDEGKMKIRKPTTLHEGRLATIEILQQTVSKKYPIMLVGVYGVSGKPNTSESKALWKDAGRCIREFRKRWPRGGVISAGDFNAHAISGDGARTGLKVDNDFASFLYMNNLTDVVDLSDGSREPTHVPPKLRMTHEKPSIEYEQGEGEELGDEEQTRGGNRLDRIYVGEEQLKKHVVRTGQGELPEGVVKESDHRLVWCDFAIEAWVVPPMEKPFHGEPRVAAQGADEITHTRSKGFPTWLSKLNEEGMQWDASIDETIEWLKRGGYEIDDILATPRLKDGRPWLVEWIKGGRRKGGLSTPTWISTPGEKSPLDTFELRIGGPRQKGEHWIKWNSEGWCRHAESRGKGWKSLESNKDGTKRRVESIVKYSCIQKERGIVLYVEHRENTVVKKEQVRKYLKSLGLTANITLTELEGVARSKVNQDDDKRYHRWHVIPANDDNNGNRWLRTFGTDVMTKTNSKSEWVSNFATGWTRYRSEVARLLQNKDDADDVNGGDVLKVMEDSLNRGFGVLNEAGRKAFGMCGGSVRTRGGLCMSVAEASTKLLVELDELLSREHGVNELWARSWLPWARTCGLTDTVNNFCTRGGAEKARAGRDLANLRSEVREEIKRMTRAARRRGIKNWKKNMRVSFLSNKKRFLRMILRRKISGGGAVPNDFDGNGEPLVTHRDRMADVEKAYGPTWAPELPDVRHEVTWWEDVIKPHEWINEEVYDGLLLPITDEELKLVLNKQGGTAPGPSGVTRDMIGKSGPAGVNLFREIFDKIIESGTWPRVLLEGLIYPICKKEGPCVITNARPITLLETATKIVTGILSERLKRVLSVHPWLEHSQLAFLPGVDIMDNIEVDSFLWEDARKNNKELHVAYMDCSKAYDSMRTWHTEAALRAHKLPEKFIKLLVAHDNVEGGRRVISQIGLSGSVTFPGMAQGEVTSPVKFVYSQDPLARWLSDYGKPVEIGMNDKKVKVVALQFCDDLNVYGSTASDLQHNVGIIAEWCRVTQMRMNGPKSTYMTTTSVEGVTPEWSPSLKGKWEGGRDGIFIPDEGDEERLQPKAADEAVRTLGVWRAASGAANVQMEVLNDYIRKITEPVTKYGNHLGSYMISDVFNTVLIPALAYPLKDASLWGTMGGERMITDLDKNVRRAFKKCCGLSDKTSTPQLYTSIKRGGYGLLSIRDVVDRAVVERFWRCLQSCPRMKYWERRAEEGITPIKREAERRRELVGAPHLVANAILKAGRDDATSDKDHMWGGGKNQTAGGRARALWNALSRHGLTLERDDNLRRARGKWLLNALGEIGGELADTIASQNLLWVGDVATKDGMRIRPFRDLQWNDITAKSDKTRMWYWAVRRALCLSEESALLKEEYRTESIPPAIEEYGVCWWTEEEVEDHPFLKCGEWIRPFVKVARLDEGGEYADLIVWDNVEGSPVASIGGQRQVGTVKGIDIQRLVWFQGHTEEGGKRARFQLNNDGDKDALVERAKSIALDMCDDGVSDGYSDASTEDSYCPPGVEEGHAVSFSDGSAYEGMGSGPRLVGSSSIRYSWDSSEGKVKSVTNRESLFNGGLPAYMQSNSGTGEIWGTILALRMHISEREERELEGLPPQHTTHFVDYETLVKMARHSREDDPRRLAKLANRPYWMMLWSLLKEVPLEEFKFVHQYSHEGDRGEFFVDRHAKRIARDGCRMWANHEEHTDVTIVLAREGIPIIHGVAETMKAIAVESHHNDWMKQKVGALTVELIENGGRVRDDKTRFEHRVMAGSLPTAIVNHRDRPHIYESDICMICKSAIEDTQHWLLECEGCDEVELIRRRAHEECEELLRGVLSEDILCEASGWFKRPDWSKSIGGNCEEWMRSKGVVEHTFVARWVRAKGDRVFIRPGDGTGVGIVNKKATCGGEKDASGGHTPGCNEQVVKKEVFWRLLALWEGGRRGENFAREVCDMLKSLKDGARREGRSMRKKKMCWATPRELLWIFVEELGIEGELACDVLNMFEGFSKWWTWESNENFRGGGLIRRDGLRREAYEEARYGYINPEYNGEDVGKGGERVDQVMEAIKLASETTNEGGANVREARRFVLVIPLFDDSRNRYRATVKARGGRIVFECPPDTMGFIPDQYWRGGSGKRVGNIKHIIGIVLFENEEARKEKPYDDNMLKKRIKNWHEVQGRRNKGSVEDDETEKATFEIPVDLKFWMQGKSNEVENSIRGGIGLSEEAKRSHWYKVATWNPVLGGLGYVPPQMKALLKELRVPSVDAKEVCAKLGKCLRVTANGVWSARNRAQLRIEKETGITSEDKRNKEKAKEYRGLHKTMTGKQKALIREEMSQGKVHKPPMTDAVGRVVARFCMEVDCQRETRVTGLYCPTCDARLPSRARLKWNPMKKLEGNPWSEEDDYWKGRAIESIRSPHVTQEMKKKRAAELGWFGQDELREILKRNWVVDEMIKESRETARDRDNIREMGRDTRELRSPLRSPSIGGNRNRYEGINPVEPGSVMSRRTFSDIVGVVGGGLVVGPGGGATTYDGFESEEQGENEGRGRVPGGTTRAASLMPKGEDDKGDATENHRVVRRLMQKVRRRKRQRIIGDTESSDSEDLGVYVERDGRLERKRKRSVHMEPSDSEETKGVRYRRRSERTIRDGGMSGAVEQGKESGLDSESESVRNVKRRGRRKGKGRNRDVLTTSDSDISGGAERRRGTETDGVNLNDSSGPMTGGIISPSGLPQVTGGAFSPRELRKGKMVEGEWRGGRRGARLRWDERRDDKLPAHAQWGGGDQGEGSRRRKPGGDGGGGGEEGGAKRKSGTSGKGRDESEARRGGEEGGAEEGSQRRRRRRGDGACGERDGGKDEGNEGGGRGAGGRCNDGGGGNGGGGGDGSGDGGVTECEREDRKGAVGGGGGQGGEGGGLEGDMGERGGWGGGKRRRLKRGRAGIDGEKDDGRCRPGKGKGKGKGSVFGSE